VTLSVINSAGQTGGPHWNGIYHTHEEADPAPASDSGMKGRTNSDGARIPHKFASTRLQANGSFRTSSRIRLADSNCCESR
jgi:hypothetical protein